MHEIINIILIVLNAINISIHSFGAYILTCLYRRELRTCQQIYLINLSLCELLMNILEMSRRIPKVIDLSSEVRNIVEYVQHYFLIAMFTGISFVFYADMVYITLDRLLNVLFNFRYTASWGNGNAKLLVCITWIVGCTLSITFSVIHYLIDYEWEYLFFVYVYPTFEVGFILLATATYVLLFRAYRKSRLLSKQYRRRRQTVYQQRKETTDFEAFCRSRFIVPVALVLTFILFMLIPDLIYLFYGIIGNNKSETLSSLCWVSYAFSNILDGVIYVFMQTPVKNMIREKFERLLNFKKMKGREKYYQTTDCNILPLIPKKTQWLINLVAVHHHKTLVDNKQQAL